MRKFIIAMVTLLAVGTTASAQGFGWGVKAGLNLSGMSNLGGDTKAGFTAGVFADYRLNTWFGVSADLLFSQQGTRGTIEDNLTWPTDGPDVKVIWKTQYLNLPILANFYVLDGLAFKIGIQPGVRLSAKLKLKEGGQEASEDAGGYFNTFDFAFPIGVSYEFMGKIIVDARYNIGVANITSPVKVRNNVFALTLGYRF